MISMLKGRMSGRAKCWTIISSSWLLATTNTTNPLRSKSSDSDLVKGSAGEPAITTTSIRPPLRERRARLDFVHRAVVLYVR